ncbi:MAG: tRNA (adenosine(37)-N6)-dimethylallyltransferase MiaA [Acidimicrobiia bacterium]|nr:tRNA (adenosine(37)-N6)-dimethylallyltransferase MiaA [Acidimicrobiia bacterium]MYF83956.1 tRNA (adenosine(37)-N6)-dimethylallyltransferase MiaA [Acidimicrobiia bacterium]
MGSPRQPARIIAVLGPTASGKSDLGMELARRSDGEIVSVDSMQVYRGMDIGTAKPSPHEQAEIRHHMIDLVDPDEDYAVAEFQRTGRAAIAAIAARERPVVIVGGSGLYFRSLVDPLRFPPSDPAVRAAVRGMPRSDAVADLLEADPGAGDHVDLANPRRVSRALEVVRLGGGTPTERAADPLFEQVKDYRPEVRFAAIGVDPGDALGDRVEHRIDLMLRDGLVEEVAGLADRLGRTASSAVGYRQMLPVVAGSWSVREGREATVRATMALARKQRTYFGRDPRIRWLDWHPDPAARHATASRLIGEMTSWSS